MHFRTRLFLPFLIVCTALKAFAKEGQEFLSFDINRIPANLKTNADAIVRYNNASIDIKSINRIVYKRAYAITIMNEKGKEYASLVVPYSLLNKVNNIKGTLRDKNGKYLRNAKNRDIEDISTFGLSYAFHSDARMKVHSFGHKEYPYTIEYEIEQTYSTTFFIPSCIIQPGYNCAVESTGLTLKYPESTPVRYKEYLLPSNTKRDSLKEEGGIIKHTWEVKHINACEAQPFSETSNYNYPTIELSSAGTFSLMTYTGDMHNWNSLGSFIYHLNKGRDSLPDRKKTEVHQLVDATNDTFTKIQKLYQHMQQTTRYVANQYGISGWQTFDAAHVANNGYGDCKGLTNYLKALLHEAGIKSYAALVYAENNYYQLDESFPSNAFNHVILCIPQKTDSIWVECTSQEFDAGYLGAATQGRKALLITEEGGFLCNTPSYDKDINYIRRKSVIDLDITQKAQKVDLNNKYSGIMQDELVRFLKKQSTDKVKEYANTAFSFPSYKVNNYSYENTYNYKIPVIEENVSLSASGITNITENRAFININWLGNPLKDIYQATPRTKPIVLNISFQLTDSVFIPLPEGYEMEAQPQPVYIDHSFARYRLTLEASGNGVWLVRHFEQDKGIYSADEFDSYQQLYRTLKKESASLLLVLRNKSS